MADNLVFTVQYTTDKSCSVQTNLKNWSFAHINTDNLADFDVLKLSVDTKTFGYFNLSHYSRSSSQHQDAIFINGLYASKIGFTNNAKVSAELLRNVDVCVRAWLEPISVDDWEILELHAEQVEMSLLDQTRVLWPGQIFPLWVSGSVCIFLRTVSLEPNSQCGILMPLTELIIEPKINRNIESNGASHRLKTTIAKNGDLFSADSVQPLPIQQCSSSDIPEGSLPMKSSDKEAPNEVRRSLFQRFLRLTLIRNFIRLFSYIFYLLWHRLLPAIGAPFNLFQITPAIEKKKTDSKLNKNVLASIKNFPDKVNFVGRVIPMTESREDFRNSHLTIYDQSGYVLLNAMSEDQQCHCDAKGSRAICHCENKKNLDVGFFLVGLKELKFLKDGENNEPSLAKEVENSSEAVIRLCVQSLSKFALFFHDEEISEKFLKNVKMSSVLRRQLGIGISSRICLKKLKKIPKQVTNNVSKIVIRVLDALELPENVTAEDLKLSFQRWLDIVANKDRPIPIVTGSIFSMPLQQFLTPSDTNDGEGTNVDIVVEKIFTSEDKAVTDYFLISSEDVSNIEFQFVLSRSNKPTGVKNLSDTDPNIPHESSESLLKAHRDIISSCLQHSDAVFQSRPIPTKLSKSVKPIYPGCVLLTGAGGVGKTTLCKALLRKLAISSNHTYVRWLSCSILKGKKPETIKKILNNVWMELQWRQPSALLLDDMDTLVSSFESPDGDRSPNATYALQLASVFKEIFSLICKHSNHVFVIVTASSEQSIHPLLLPSHGCHLFGKTITLELPDTDERVQIMRSILLNNIGLSKQAVARINFDEIAHAAEGFSAKDFVKLTKRAMLSSKSRHSHSHVILLKTEDYQSALSGFVPISLQNANLHKPRKMSWSDVGGLHDVRKQLMEKLIWPIKYAHLYQTAGMQLQTGIMLYGPPGCGKTLLAGVVANECKLNFISVKGPELLSKYIGASEAAVREIFMRASAAAPCILFFDEFDSIAQKRGHDSTGVTDRVVNQILTHLDGVEPLSGVFVLAATSRPDLIDPALLRPGRLDTHLHCPMPNFDDRCDILKSLLDKVRLADEVNIKTVAARCEHFTGADLRALVYDTQLNALHGYGNNEMGTKVPCASISPPISLAEMELDEEYSSNGIKSIHQDIKDDNLDSDSSSSGVKVTVTDFTKTAESLIESIENDKASDAHLKAGEYKICYGLSSPEYSSNDLRQFDRSLSATISETSSQRSIYFPSLYSKVEGVALPEAIQQLVQTASNFSSNEAESNKQESNRGNIPEILVANHHLETALESASPSVSSSERQRYIQICQNFTGKTQENLESGDNIDSNSTMWELRRHQRTTLA